MKKAIGYVRVSTEEQAKEGVSLEAQEERIRKYAEYKGFELVEVIRDEGKSGGTANREGFQKLLARIEANGFDALILFNLDRLSRDMLTLLALERLLDECNVELHTIEGQIDTSTPDGFMNFAMRAFLSEMERRQIKYRTKKALEHKKAKGEVVGQVPYGYRRAGDRLVEDEEEQSIIKKINRMYKLGKSLNAIAKALNDSGYRTKAGTPWTAQQVKRLIRGYESRKSNANTDKIKAFILSLS